MRNTFPIWQTPKGSFFLVVFKMFLNWIKIPCAVSGLKYRGLEFSKMTPWWVLKSMLKGLMGVQLEVPKTWFF
ncbi:MAG: hypothetical protein N7Q72_00355, partial [Spiroplasma sp. Tabriz.8]|nr:hypothetical protein [Spiroplasma sp. Tabriz.8]